MIVKLPRVNYIDNIINYYFDNIWELTDDSVDLPEWLKKTYRARYDRTSAYIEFDNEADATMFRLRWS